MSGELFGVGLNVWAGGAILVAVLGSRFWPLIVDTLSKIKLPSFSKPVGPSKALTRDEALAGFNVAFAFMQEQKCSAGMQAMREALPHFYHDPGEHSEG